MIPEKLKTIILDLESTAWIRALLNISDVYIVGGTVRDAYRNAPIKDIDLIVEGLTMEEIKSLLNPYGKIKIVGESFAVIKFKPKGYIGEDFDIAIPRTDEKSGEGHKDFIIKTEQVNLLQDLKRRDFTINSIAANIETGEIIDPYNGLVDLKKEQLRATDKNAFIEDPLRILRGVQFACRFNFELEPFTFSLMKKHAEKIKNIPGERILEELMKIVNKKGDTGLAFELIRESDIDLVLFGRKIEQTNELPNLDPTSFFYILSLLGHVDPYTFSKKSLKSDNGIAVDAKSLDTLMDIIVKNPSEEDLKFYIFKSIQKSPSILDVVIFPMNVKEIIDNIKSGDLPKSLSDIKIDGNDVMEIGNLSPGSEVGLIKETILRDALMNRYNWNDREKSMEYLRKLLK